MRPLVLDRLRASLDVDYFVTGSYLVTPPSLQLYLRLQDARSGRIVAGASETGTASHLPSLAQEAIAAVLRDRDWTGAAQDKASAVLGPYTNPASAQLYAEGLDRLRRDDARAANDLFQRASAADPKNPLAHSGSSAALSRLGYEKVPQAEAKLAYDLSAALPREERLRVEARYRASMHDYPRAIAIYRSLWTLFVDNPEYGLNLAEVQIDARKAGDALDTVAALRSRLKGKTEARVDLIEAEAAGLQSDNNRKLEAATRASATARSLGARVTQAEAETQRGDAFFALDRDKEALTAYRSAKNINREMEDAFRIASILNRQGRVLWKEGDYAPAKKFWQDALVLFQQIGNQSAVPTVLNNLALIARAQDDQEGALRLFDQAAAVAGEIGATSMRSSLLNNAGNVLRRLNRPDEARRDYEECLALAVENNDRTQVARSQVTLSMLDFDDGNLVRAGRTSAAGPRNPRQSAEYALDRPATLGRSQKRAGRCSRSSQGIRRIGGYRA